MMDIRNSSPEKFLRLHLKNLLRIAIKDHIFSAANGSVTSKNVEVFLGNLILS